MAGRLSDNYYLRKCFLEREQVPTQSVMIKKMSPPLAKVYFNSMNYNLKVLAGFEPRMKGGGNDWYIPPKKVLDGRLVMQPVKHQYLTQLGFNGIALFGEQLVAQHHHRMEVEKQKVLLESDINWKNSIEATCRQTWEDASKEAALANTLAIQNAFHQFSNMYTTSINKIEELLFDASVKEIQVMRDAAFEKMRVHYEQLVKSQATMLYDRYTKKLNKEKERLKENFIHTIEVTRTATCNQIHDINIEKHIVIEKQRQLLESMKLACQVYVALKEREECKKEMELSQHKHKKKIDVLKQEIEMTDFEIRLEIEKEKKRQEFNTIWKKKVCEVVKKFQMFAAYCLRELPEHADFFIDIEKLMMIQLSKASEEPIAESIIEIDDEPFHTPVPKPHPFYLFCDKGYKTQVDQDLCPKHCTSSASQLPVVVINKRCIYAACDNFEKFSDKIAEFIHGRRGDDNDFKDDHIYEHDFPVKITSSQQLLELKLESSIMQVLQKELPNIKEVSTECCVCKIPYCFCSPLHASKMSFGSRIKSKTPSIATTVHSGNKINTRAEELVHEREPKWESYMQYVLPKKCKCGKLAKKHLEEHLPAYMRKTSPFDELRLPNYEKCRLSTLKKLVKKAQGKVTLPIPEKVESKTRDIGVQYSKPEFDLLCTCFSEEEVAKLFKKLMKGPSMTGSPQLKVVGDDVTSTRYLSRRASSFATECARSLKALLDDSPQLEEIFKRDNCQF